MLEPAGETFGKYRITTRLGQGGFATVYRAVDTTLDREVALKVLDPLLLRDETFLIRFQREARAVARLNHPHIVTIYEIGQHQGQQFIAMHYLPGPTLAQIIARQGAMNPMEVVRLAEQVASALDYAHRQGLVHRDVKPANVLLNERGEAVLTDFGIARVVGESRMLTRTGASIGTPQYMAPEQWTTGQVDARSDVYAFGIMLYQMLTGQVPFDGETSRIMYGHVHEAPPPPQALNPALPPAVGQVLLKALAKDPAQRYGTAGELVAALKAALAGQRVAEPPTVAVSAKPAPVPKPKRGWLVHPAIVVGALAALALVVGVILLAGRSGPTLTPVPMAERAITPELTSVKVAVAVPTATFTPTPTRRPTATPTRMPPSTPTMTPTPRPTPTPTATIDADPTVYDNFNNPANDGSFNRSQWRYKTDPPNQIAQQDGILIVTQDGKPEKTALVARKYDGVTLNTPTFFEARLMLSPDQHAGNVQLHLWTDRAGRGDWFSECVIDHSDEQASAGCWDTIYPEQDGHVYASEGKQVGYGTWHTFRIEVDPATMTFTYYMDGQMIGSHVPVDAEELKKARFKLIIGVWGPSSEALTGYIDDVRIGNY